ncbi:hypothetical protein ACNHKD_03785 [Methylocystis sp. JAN1]|uniref:hypothetical protein n=1 Tax=Methylocystis sp. JAN1 TaxID=3397211 RepID=UPI003FA2F4CD
MLSFECEEDTIKIALDSIGLEQFITILRQLEKRRGHMHLLTPSNGGHELDEKTPWGNKAIGEVIIDLIE